jgi:hypothetical protein
MPAFFFAFLAALVLGTGARDQRVLAQLALRQGQRPAALLTALGCAGASSLLAASASLGAFALPPGVRQTVLLLAAALAGAELLFSRAPKTPLEPTGSLAALSIVIFAHQLTDAARLLIFALALAVQSPWTAAMGGAVGSALALSWGWSMPGIALRGELASLRRGLGVLVLAGAALAFFA